MKTTEHPGTPTEGKENVMMPILLAPIYTDDILVVREGVGAKMPLETGVSSPSPLLRVLVLEGRSMESLSLFRGSIVGHAFRHSALTSCHGREHCIRESRLRRSTRVHAHLCSVSSSHITLLVVQIWRCVRQLSWRVPRSTRCGRLDRRRLKLGHSRR